MTTWLGTTWLGTAWLGTAWLGTAWLGTTWLGWATLLAAGVAAVRGIWSPCGLSMLSAINPLSERARGNRYWLTCAWFVVGAVLGGAALGTGSALAAWALRPLASKSPAAAVALGLAGALVCLAADAGVPGVRLPLHPRQVDERWLGAYRRWVYAAGFGAQIGAGFATYVMTACTYLFVLLAVVSGSVTLALGAGVLFGLVRGAAVLLSARVRSPSALHALHRRLEMLGPWSLRLAVLAEAVVAVVLGWVVWGAPGLVGASAAVVLLVVAGRHSMINAWVSGRGGLTTRRAA